MLMERWLFLIFTVFSLQTMKMLCKGSARAHQRCAAHTLNLIADNEVDKWLASNPESRAVYHSATAKCSALWTKASHSCIWVHRSNKWKEVDRPLCNPVELILWCVESQKCPLLTLITSAHSLLNVWMTGNTFHSCTGHPTGWGHLFLWNTSTNAWSSNVQNLSNANKWPISNDHWATWGYCGCN